MFKYESDSSIINNEEEEYNSDTITNNINSYVSNYSYLKNNSGSCSNNSFLSNNTSRVNSQNNSYENNFFENKNDISERYKRTEKKNQKLKYQIKNIRNKLYREYYNKVIYELKIILKDVEINNNRNKLDRENYNKVIYELKIINSQNKIYKVLYSFVLKHLLYKTNEYKNNKIYILYGKQWYNTLKNINNW